MIISDVKPRYNHLFLHKIFIFHSDPNPCNIIQWTFLSLHSSSNLPSSLPSYPFTPYSTPIQARKSFLFSNIEYKTNSLRYLLFLRSVLFLLLFPIPLPILHLSTIHTWEFFSLPYKILNNPNMTTFMSKESHDKYMQYMMSVSRFSLEYHFIFDYASFFQHLNKRTGNLID